MIPFEKFTDKAKQALQKAQEILLDTKQVQLDTEHVLYGIAFVEESILPELLRQAGVDAEKALDKIRGAVTHRPQVEVAGGVGQIYVTPPAARLFDLAFEEAKQMGDEFVGTEHLLLGMFELREGAAYRVLSSLGLTKEKVLAGLKEIRGYRRVDSAQAEETYQALKRFTVDLTEKARQGKIDPIIGREPEMQRVIEILSRRTKNNPVLIGDPGVGKTAIVEGLALKIAQKRVPEPLLDKHVLQLDMAGLVAGTKFRGEFEDRMKAVLDEIVKRKRSVILFIDELHTVVGAGAAEGAIDASNILKPALARGDLQAIGATTITEYRKHIEKDPALERRFQPVMVEEPSPEDTLAILRGIREKYEEHHHLKIPDDALEAAVKLSTRYITGRFLPDKAIDVIDEAAARARLRALSETARITELESQLQKLQEQERQAAEKEDYETAARYKQEESRLAKEMEAERARLKDAGSNAVATPEVIAEVVSQWSGVPVTRLTEAESDRLLRMEEELGKRIVGQKEAVHLVSETIRRAKSGLADPNRPLGSFIFLGPTGVGKTELVKVLADFLFGSTDAIVRIDMSEYMEKHSVSRLVGAPPGYVGYEEGGQLTERVKRQPFSIVLLDEIEKAHPDVFNILLQVLDDGRLTDNKGVTVNFKNTVVIMTSNIGSSEIAEIAEGGRLGFRSHETSREALREFHEQAGETALNLLKKTMRPEFLNRIDEIVVFHPLTREQVKQIALLRVDDLRNRLAEREVEMELTDAALEQLAEEGYNPSFGARPMKRAIQRFIGSPLSQKLIAGEISEGSRVVVDFADGEFRFTVAAKEGAG
ncbi:MAG: hypothetical protein B1H03_00965 [Planctomycetales bacterium 4484_113]|nr:MAG: hypothetical protein B1H03_00965 [Planctomycetales bacterium 4484_113]